MHRQLTQRPPRRKKCALAGESKEPQCCHSPSRHRPQDCSAPWQRLSCLVAHAPLRLVRVWVKDDRGVGHRQRLSRQIAHAALRLAACRIWLTSPALQRQLRLEDRRVRGTARDGCGIDDLVEWDVGIRHRILHHALDALHHLLERRRACVRQGPALALLRASGSRHAPGALAECCGGSCNQGLWP